MKIKIVGTQIYEEHEEKIEQEYENAVLDINNVISLKYPEGEIIYDQKKNYIEIKNENNIIVELKNEKILNYSTPYGIINLKTIGEDISLEKKPFKLMIKYKIVLNEKIAYKNILEIFEV